ncbi:hypothetical protein K3495_g8146 [Podosphaera aphanis]|nr:hypothetical protein K3495_g8146 [Podosphaera aphanis]
MSRESVFRGDRVRSATRTIVSQQPPPRHLYSESQAQIQNLVLESKMSFTQPLPTSPRTPHTPRTPRTPRRSSGRDDSEPHEHGSKQRSHKNCSSKKIVTSPIMDKKFQNSSPPNRSQSAGFPSDPINTPPIAAYAGPTFHASPAPSALPIPSFYSKSVPDSHRLKGSKTLINGQISTPPSAHRPPSQGLKQESPLDFFFGSKNLVNNHISTPPTVLRPPSQEFRHESPLDIFFKADREQKERARNISMFK